MMFLLTVALALNRSSPTPLPPEMTFRSPGASPPIVACAKCGAALPAEAKFCAACGKTVGAEQRAHSAAVEPAQELLEALPTPAQDRCEH